MPGFCIGCGSAIGGKAEFCGSCGARAATLSPGQPAAKSGALKIVLIVGGVLFVFGALSVGAMYYTAHRYLRMAEAATGVKAEDVVSSLRDRGSNGPRRDGCQLLSKDEAADVLGIPVERIDGRPNDQESGEHCDFYVKPESVERSPAQPGQGSSAVTDIAKQHARAMSGSDTPYFGFTVERENGKLAFTAFQMARRLSGVDSLSDKEHSEPPDVGDRALMAIGDSQMCVVKGRSSITLNLMQITGGRDKGIALARKIVSRL